MKIISLTTWLGEGVTAEPETYERTGTIRDEEEAYYYYDQTSHILSFPTIVVPSPPRRPTGLRLRAQPNPQPRYGRVRTCRPYRLHLPNFPQPTTFDLDTVLVDWARGKLFDRERVS